MTKFFPLDILWAMIIYDRAYNSNRVCVTSATLLPLARSTSRQGDVMSLRVHGLFCEAVKKLLTQTSIFQIALKLTFSILRRLRLWNWKLFWNATHLISTQ